MGEDSTRSDGTDGSHGAVSTASAAAVASDARGKVGIISLGCPKNLVDTEIMLGELEAKGFELTHDLDQAETVIVNTCGFIDEAKQESIDTILEVAERKRDGARQGVKGGGRVARLLVAGCMVNRYAQELESEIPEIDGFIGLDDLREVPKLITLGGLSAPEPSAAHVVFDHTAARRLTTRGHAFLKVAEGCNNPCTFCAIPVWRGRFRSRTLDSLVEEARALEEQGVAEISLLAQDTTRYGEDLGYGRHGLLRLVEALLEQTSIPWIRFLYAYPATLDEALLELMGAEPRFCSYLDIPLQHSHPEILKAMRRGGSAKRYLRLLERAHDLVPDLSVRSTFIVGFPGEREHHFQHLLDFVGAAELDHLGVFTYSPETDTPSSSLDERASPEDAAERKERLLEHQRPIAQRRRERLVGRRLEALMEGVHEETDHLLVARHQGMAPEVDGRILINDGAAPVGKIVEIEVTAAYSDDCVAHVVGPTGDPEVQLAVPA